MNRRTSLLTSWRSASVQGADADGWLDGAQWWTPAVDALADALSGEPVDPVSACRLLGSQRAAAGVFLDSARRDVLNAAMVAGCSPATSASLLDALTLGWVDRTLDDYFTDACVDPLTELASLPCLMARLAEVYAESTVTGVGPAELYALVVVLAAHRSDPLEAETQMIAAQLAMRVAFEGGETLARVGRHCAVVLCRRDEPRFGRSLRILRDEIGVARVENRLPGVRVWIEALPDGREQLPAVLREINSAGR